jgi:hypothetical protein
LEEYVFQQGLPEYLKERAVVIRREPRISYAWRFEYLKQIFEWIKSEDYITRSVHVFEKSNNDLVRIQEGWIYIGDRNKDFNNSKESNRVQAFEFAETINYKYKRDLLFIITFSSINNWDEIGKAFFNRAIINAGELAYTPKDSLELIVQCRQHEKKIIGIDAFIITNLWVQPQFYYDFSGKDYAEFDPEKYFKTYHVKKNRDVGHWEESIQFIKENSEKGWVFEIDYESG